MHNQHRILRVLQLIAVLQKTPTKSIKHLSNLLKTTERTVYRYLDLIKELGFDLQKDQFNKYIIINPQINNNINFTKQEADLLKKLLFTAGKRNKLKDSILNKIYLNNDIIISGLNIYKIDLVKIVELLSEAIQNNKQVILKDYHSANSNTISDRLVEPIEFTDNYTSVAAYEIESGTTKYFNIERIGSIKKCVKNTEHKEKHKPQKTDVFGFGATDTTYEIKLRLNLRATVILKEEYPMVIPYIKAENKKANTYILQVTVNDLKPITRFVIGLAEDVEVLGSDNFILHLKQITEKLLNNKLNKSSTIVRHTKANIGTKKKAI